MQITDRDYKLMQYLAQVGNAPVDVIAKRFFEIDPRSGKLNKDPMHAAERRMSTLRKEGYIESFVAGNSALKEPGGTIVLLSDKSAKLLGITPKKVHMNHRHHHYQTLRLVENVCDDLRTKGISVTEIKLEDSLRASHLSKKEKKYLRREMDKGGVNFNGDSGKWNVPDAAIFGTDSEGKEIVVAVEYLSSNYSEKDFKDKKTILSDTRYHSSYVASDNKLTVARAAENDLQSTVLRVAYG